MFTLELKNNWQEKAEEKIEYQENGKWKKGRRLSKKQVKDILKLIVKADSTEEKENSIIYKIEI